MRIQKRNSTAAIDEVLMLSAETVEHYRQITQRAKALIERAREIWGVAELFVGGPRFSPPRPTPSAPAVALRRAA